MSTIWNQKDRFTKLIRGFDLMQPIDIKKVEDSRPGIGDTPRRRANWSAPITPTTIDKHIMQNHQPMMFPTI